MANAPSDNGNEEKTPEYVTKDDIGNIVNAAVSSHLKRANIGKTISDSIEAAFGPIREQLGARETKTEKTDKGEPNPLETEVRKLSAKLEKSEASRRATERKAAETSAYQALVGELTASGKLRPEAIGVAADLIRARGALRVDDDGSHAYRHGEEDLPLSEGVAAFLKSKEAAIFASPPNAIAKKPATTPSFLPTPKSSGQQARPEEGTPETRAAARLAEQGIDLSTVFSS